MQDTNDIIQGYRYNDALDRYGSYQVASRPAVRSGKSVIAADFIVILFDFENGQSGTSNSECSDGTT